METKKQRQRQTDTKRDKQKVKLIDRDTEKKTTK